MWNLVASTDQEFRSRLSKTISSSERRSASKLVASLQGEPSSLSEWQESGGQSGTAIDRSWPYRDFVAQPDLKLKETGMWDCWGFQTRLIVLRFSL